MNRMPQPPMDVTGNQSPSVARPTYILKPGSAIEVVYRRTVELIKGPCTPELPETGNGVTWVHDMERVLPPFMPLATDRNATRVQHYLVLLNMRGLLEIDPSNGMITLPKGDVA